MPEFDSPLIDLGWYPDSLMSGNYRLVLVSVDTNYNWNVLKKKESANRFEIRDAIEEWLLELSEDISMGHPRLSAR